MSDEDEKLLGDELEAVLEKLGADKMAELYEELTGEDCGCEGRKQWLNAKHQQVKDWWERLWNRQNS